ncbi:MAG: energy transducer TonB [Pyrinomonadaceae bacterium]
MPLRFVDSGLALIVMLFVGVVETTIAQQPSWQKIAPVGESFTILMPAKAYEGSDLIPLTEEDPVPGHEYYTLSGGKRYMVVSFMKTSGDKVPALSSFTNFMHAIERGFKSNEGETRRLTFDDNISDESGIVMKYHLKLGEYPGVARFLGSGNAFYALMVIGAEENDPDALRFMSSFVLGKINTNSLSSGITVPLVTVVGVNPDGAKRDDSPSPPDPWSRPITGGVLNGRAISLSQPKYPKAARKAGDWGRVIVRVLIDERGNVISAKALEGPETLRAAAVDAASRSRFTPTRLAGHPVKVYGEIIYNFER